MGWKERAKKQIEEQKKHCYICAKTDVNNPNIVNTVWTAIGLVGVCSEHNKGECRNCKKEFQLPGFEYYKNSSTNDPFCSESCARACYGAEDGVSIQEAQRRNVADDWHQGKMRY